MYNNEDSFKIKNLIKLFKIGMICSLPLENLVKHLKSERFVIYAKYFPHTIVYWNTHIQMRSKHNLFQFTEKYSVQINIFLQRLIFLS